MSEPELYLADIIQTALSLSGRVAIYSQNFTFPKDSNLFIILSDGGSRVLSCVTDFDPDTDEDVQTSTIYKIVNVELYSRNDDAKTRVHEIAMAIKSTYGQRILEDNNIKIWRTGQILDLTYIDGSSSLHRFRVPVIISYLETKRTAIEPIDKFQAPEVVNE